MDDSKVSPILARLDELVIEGLHPHAVRVEWLPFGPIMDTVFGDFVDMREGTTDLPDMPDGIRTAALERYPDDWWVLPFATYDEVDRWIHEAAWLSGAIDWARNVIREPDLPKHMRDGLYGPASDEAGQWLVEGPRVSWLFKPNAWLHPRIPIGIRRLRKAPRSPEKMPAWKSTPLDIGEPMETTTGGVGVQIVRRFPT